MSLPTIHYFANLQAILAPYIVHKQTLAHPLEQKCRATSSTLFHPLFMRLKPRCQAPRITCAFLRAFKLRDSENNKTADTGADNRELNSHDLVTNGLVVLFNDAGNVNEIRNATNSEKDKT